MTNCIAVLLAEVLLASVLGKGYGQTASFADPPDGTVIIGRPGATNIRFECYLLQTPPDPNSQRLTQWFIRNFRGQPGSVAILNVVPVVYSGTPSTTFATLRNVMTIPTYLADFDQAFIWCGAPNLAFPYAEWPLRIHREPSLINPFVNFPEGLSGLNVTMEDPNEPAALPYPHTINWLSFQGNTDNDTRRSFGYPVLSFNDVSRTDSGTYILNVLNSANGINSAGSGSLNLNILYGPDITLGIGERIVRTNDSAMLLCGTGLDSNPAATITWTDPDGQVVTNGGRFSLINDAGTVRLDFTSATFQDSGLWRCEVRVEADQVTLPGGEEVVNDYLVGVSLLEIRLYVADPPFPSVNVTLIQIRISDATIRWERPVLHNFEAIYDYYTYTVTATPVNSTGVVVNVSTDGNFSLVTAVVTDLQPLTNYEFVVQAFIREMGIIIAEGDLSTSLFASTADPRPLLFVNQDHYTVNESDGFVLVCYTFQRNGSTLMWDQPFLSFRLNSIDLSAERDVDFEFDTPAYETYSQLFVTVGRCVNVTIIPNTVLEVNKEFQMQIEAFDPDNSSKFFNILSQVSTLTIVDDDSIALFFLPLMTFPADSHVVEACILLSGFTCREVIASVTMFTSSGDFSEVNETQVTVVINDGVTLNQQSTCVESSILLAEMTITNASLHNSEHCFNVTNVGGSPITLSLSSEDIDVVIGNSLSAIRFQDLADCTYYRNLAFRRCGSPVPPPNGYLRDFIYTAETVSVSYQCNEGFVPSTVLNSTCLIGSGWTPGPQLHSCINTFGNLNVSFEVFMSRGDLMCPGDRYSYQCDIFFNDDAVFELMWHLSFPGYANITLNSTSMFGMTDFGIGVMTQLNDYDIQPITQTSHIESLLVLEIFSNITARGEMEVTCSTNSYRYRDVVSLPVDLAVPLMIANFTFMVFFGNPNSIATFEWALQPGVGAEAIVDNVTLSILPTPLSPPSGVIQDPPLVVENITLGHNIAYMIGIIASNCVGDSEPSVITIDIVDCRDPDPPGNGSIINMPPITTEGSIATFRCDSGFTPSAIQSTNCTDTRLWTPAPEDHICIFVIALVSLSPLPRNTSRDDIECPGDTITYNCSIQSNSETIHLTWRVTIPGQMPMNITYDENSGMPTLNNFITTSLNDVTDDYIESTIEFTVQMDTLLNQTLLECLIDGLGIETTTIHVNQSTPLMPTGFNATREYHQMMDTTLTFEWDLPPGSSPETVVDYYIIKISPSPLSHPSTNIVESPPWNVTLAHNIEYSINITAVNCAGEGEAFVPADIVLINCGDPSPPVNGFLGDTAHTREGATVTFQCSDGYVPSAVMTSTCTSTGLWTPAPENHSCIFVTASVSLTPLARNNSREDIECPSDIIPYNCSIQSNSETIHLTWRVTIPGQTPINVTYDNSTNSMFTLHGFIMTNLNIISDNYIESVLEIIVQIDVILNQTILECIIEGLGNETDTVYVNQSLPLVPTGFNFTSEYHHNLMMNTTLTFEWDLPQGSGPETVVDYYIISITPSPLSHPSTNLVESPPWNVTLAHNTIYSINITAVNCAGESDGFVLPDIEYINCDIPSPPDNGFLGDIIHTREGATVTFQCSDGYVPSAVMTSTCTSTGLWIPAPENHTCVLVIASVSLTALTRNSSRDDIECPGDTILYNCSVQSNSETIHLTWRVTVPEEMPVNITYESASSTEGQTNLLNDFITTIVSNILDGYIESTLELRVQISAPLNQTLLECFIEGLGNDMDTVFVNTSIPLMPTGFNHTNEYHDLMNTTLTFEWDLPQGNGPETVVDYYIVYVTTSPLSSPSTYQVQSSPWNVTLAHNTIYSINITAVNCAGESGAFVLPDIEYVNCGAPDSPVNGFLGDTAHTREGATVTFQCSDGYVPSAVMTSTCNSTGLWTPAPENHTCILVIASVSLTPLPRNVSRDDIECPGDSIPYNCSIQSNSETIHLTWRVTILGQMPINITYESASVTEGQTNMLNNFITTVVSNILDGYIESTLEFRVQASPSLNETLLECFIEGLGNDTTTVLVDTSIPLMPTGFNFTSEFHQMMDTTITFEWDTPQSSGPETVVDYYIISSSPTPLSHPSTNQVQSPPWNVTLANNTIYSINITAVNCAGESEAFELPDIANCGAPSPPVNGFLGNIVRTTEGATVTFQCSDGYVPSAVMTSTCTSTALWILAPEDHICTFVTALVSLTPLPRNSSREDIECPGDTIRYNCSVQSNSETIHLIWRVTIPGQLPLNITYNGGSAVNMDTILSDYTVTSLDTVSVGYIEALLEFTVNTNIDFNGTALECIIQGLGNESATLYINTSLPLIPTGFNFTSEYQQLMDTTVTFDWDPPLGSGPEAVVDHYIIYITPSPPFHPSTNQVVSPPWNVTLAHNTIYSINITAANCAGESDAYTLGYVNCGAPDSPVNGFLGDTAHTREGATVTFQCSDGYVPSAVMTSTCTSTGLWIPAPENHTCILVIASISLFSLPRNSSRDDIECPGDTIPYNCSIQSNSETIHLTWRVTIPGQMPINITYDNASSTNSEDTILQNFITSSLVTVREEEYIEANLEFVVNTDVAFNGTTLECIIEGLGNELTVFVNTSAPLTPTGFNLTAEYHQMTDTTLTFEWDTSQGSGVETVVDYYIVSILPVPLSHPSTNVVESPPWNVTLAHNTIYSINITAVNCAGESEAFVLPDIEYVNCGVPTPTLNGFLSYPHTREGAVASLQCSDGYIPSAIRTSVCTSTAEWILPPNEYNCTLVIATVNLSPLSRNMSRQDIECPGDTISYNCSIQSNSETIHLTWRVTIPGQMPINLTYYENSTITEGNLNSFVRSDLLSDDIEGSVESVLEFTVQSVVLLNQTEVECLIEDLENESIIVFVDQSTPLIPTGLNFTREYHQMTDTTIMLEWDPPQGSGPEAVVDHYIINISPSPLSHPSTNLVESPPWNVTLAHNTTYSINLTAVNCAGESSTSVLPDIEFINCGVPDPPNDGSIEDYPHTREGAVVTFLCNDGYIPSAVRSATCSSSAMWIPAPDEQNCTLVIAFVELNDLPRNVSRGDIECPGDIIPYNCSVRSNSETIHLTWRVTIPGQMPINVTYNESSDLSDVIMLTSFIATRPNITQSDYIVSTLELTVQPDISLNQTILECIIEGLGIESDTVLVNQSIPLMPTGFNFTIEYHQMLNTTLTFEWDPPLGSGPEAIVDYYVISITPSPPSHPSTNQVQSPPWNVTLAHNTIYSINITAANCAGESDAFVLPDIEYVNCNVPIPPMNGNTNNYPHTREGATLNFQCDDGFLRSTTEISICTSSAAWVPDPSQHNCTLVIASVSLTPLSRNVSREDIECPGDTIPYRCSIQSNSETIHLIWRVTIPGQLPINITYDNSSETNINEAGNAIITHLDAITSDSVNSTLELIVMTDVISLNQTTLECIIEGLGNESVTVFVNESFPLTPTGFNFTAEYHQMMDTTLTFEWDPPQGSGPETVVDYYVISVMPSPLSHPSTNIVLSPPWNVTLAHNVIYSINITAVNCAGESDGFVLPDVEYINCGVPVPPSNASLEGYPHTREGAVVTYGCDEDFVPSAPVMSVCTSSALWIPALSDHKCIFVIASVILNPLPRNVSRPDIECPGDTIPYSCSIQSNSETVHLIWRVTIPEQEPVNITYNSTSDLQSVNFLRDFIIAYPNNASVRYIEATLEFTVQTQVPLNQTIVECIIEDINSESDIVFVKSAIPRVPSDVKIGKEDHRIMDSTITWEWDPPQGSGSETVVDYHMITISPAPLSHPSSNVVVSPPWNVTIAHNTIYSINITAVNCAGESDPFILVDLEIVNCGTPATTINGILGEIPHTREGVEVSFRCNEGYVPSAVMAAKCTSSATWDPLPVAHNCTLVTASTTLAALERNSSRVNIECPGDIIPYNCSILSNSETISLRWQVTTPGQIPSTVTYNGTSVLNSEDAAGANIISTLTSFMNEAYIESVIMLEVPSNIFAFNNTVVDCSFDELANDTATVLFNSAVPLIPFGFMFTQQFDTLVNTTITFEWDPPQGSGPEAVVDYYVITISPNPLSHSSTNMVESSPWNVTLSYNVEYTVNITALNCAGNSDTFILSNVRFVDCAPPPPPLNGRIIGFTDSKEGTPVSFQCVEGYVPSIVLNSTCTNLGVWEPVPAEHNCTLVEAQVLLIPLPRNVSRQDIECPGDTISFSCSVTSNSEVAELMWLVTIPGETPFAVLYNITSAVNSIRSNLDSSVSTILTRRDTTILTELTKLETIESLITFTVRNGSLNNTEVQCSSEDLNAENLTVFVNASVPLSPTNFQTTEEYETRLDITFSFYWNPPSSGGVETIVDYYIVTIMPQPLSHPMSNVFPEPLVNVTLSYNVHYTATIVSVNCVGQSSPVTLTVTNTAGCGIPVSPQNGYFGDYSSTREGTRVTFQCSDAYVPSVVRTTVCTMLGANTLWLPAPQDHICILETANLTLVELETNRTSIIDCPEDTKIYSCSIISNTEDLHLQWDVHFPDGTFETVTYDNISSAGSGYDLDKNVTATLIAIDVGEGKIESTIELQSFYRMNGTVVNCSIGNLNHELVMIFVNASAPLPAVRVLISETFEKLLHTTVMLMWILPQGSGPEYVSESYQIIISSEPILSTYIVFSITSRNITLEYNVNYNVSVVTLNCAGQSNPTSLYNVEYISCGPPTPPVNGSVANYSVTTEGTSVTFNCDSGFTPRSVITTVCTSDGTWQPAPQDHNCSLVDNQNAIIRGSILTGTIPISGLILGIIALLLTIWIYLKHNKKSKVKSQEDDLVDEESEKEDEESEKEDEEEELAKEPDKKTDSRSRLLEKKIKSKRTVKRKQKIQNLAETPGDIEEETQEQSKEIPQIDEPVQDVQEQAQMRKMVELHRMEDALRRDTLRRQQAETLYRLYASRESHFSSSDPDSRGSRREAWSISESVREDDSVEDMQMRVVQSSMSSLSFDSGEDDHNMASKRSRKSETMVIKSNLEKLNLM